MKRESSLDAIPGACWHAGAGAYCGGQLIRTVKFFFGHRRSYSAVVAVWPVVIVVTHQIVTDIFLASGKLR